jgi:hypothetical protein
MLKLLFKDALKTPWKLLALCFVIYLASLSIIVLIFLGFLAAHWIRKTIQQQTKALAAAEAEANRAGSAPPVVPVAPAVTTVASVTPAAAPDAPQPTPKRQYAKSAVVIQFRTGTRD